MGFGQLDNKNLLRTFIAAFDAAEVGSWASRVGQVVTSDRAIEEYAWLGNPAVMREWVGGRLLKRPRVEAYSLKNKRYEASTDLPVMDILRDKTQGLMTKVTEIAQQAALHWEKIITDAILANGLCYDGQNFFDTDHVSGDSGTLINALTTTQVKGLIAAVVTAPTSSEMAAAILGMIGYLYGMKDDNGEPINQNARQWVVMVPHTMMGAAMAAVDLKFLTSGNSNPLLATNFKIEVVVNPRLNGTLSYMYVFRTDGAMKSFLLQDEVPVQTKMLAADSAEEFHNDQWLFGVDASRAVGYGKWQGAAKGTFATS